MPIKDPIRRREYQKAWKEAHKESEKSKIKAWKEANKESEKSKIKAWYEAHKEEHKANVKAWKESHREQCKEYMKEWYSVNREECKAYTKSDLNSLGQTKTSIRKKSQRYLKKYGTKIQGYQIHHCCTYTEPYKFIYCSKEMHRLIHSYLRQHNIDADSDHYEQIKHLLDDTVVVYGIE